MALLIRCLAAAGLAVLAYLVTRYGGDVPDKESLASAIVVGIVCGYCGPR